MTNIFPHFSLACGDDPFLIPHSSFLILSYRPFLEPLPLDDYWMWLLIPLVFGICVVYKTIKEPDLRRVPRRALGLTAQVLVFMALAAAAIWLTVELL